MRVVVVGGGIAGLAAALRLRDELGAAARITVLDQAGRLGGKLRTEAFGDGYSEAGAEAFVVTDPAAVELAGRVGLGDALRHPATGRAALAIAGELVPIPAGTLMGVPADPAAVAGVAEVGAQADPDGGRPLLGPGQDVAVGALVRARLGGAVLDRLVDPLLGGVYAGRGDDLSLAATVPALAAACRTESTLTGAVRAALARRASTPGPVFATIDGGVGRLVDAVAAATDAQIRLGAPVRSLERVGGAGRVGGAWRVDGLDADAVVLAIPARPAARLLAGISPDAAAEVGVLDYASVALVTFAVRGARLPDLSGFLVPASEGYAVKAFTSAPSGRTRHGRAGWRCCAPRSGGTARRRYCTAATTTSQRSCMTSWAGCWARRCRYPRRCGSPGGAARCRSTRRGTWTGSRAPVRRWPTCRGWRWPGRPTTGSAFPPASGRVGRPPSGF